MSKENVNIHNLGVGARVLAGKEFDKHGVIKFIGPTTFSDVQGDWIGICLDTPDGKNNGSHTGVHYFDADENHGLFVKNWSQVKPEVSEVPKPKTSVRTSLSGTVRDKPATKTEVESKTSSTAAIAANKEKLAALREKRSQTAAAASASASTVSPIAPTRPALNSTKVDVPATPKRMSLSASRESFATPVAGAEGSGSLSTKQFPSMCAQDFLDIKTPGKENPLIEMMQASIYKLTKQEDEHVVQITEQNLTIFTLKNEASLAATQIDELTVALERATTIQASSDVVIDSLQASVVGLESSLAEKSSALEKASHEATRSIASLSDQLEAATQQIQQLVADNSQSSVMDSLQQTINDLREKELQSTAEMDRLLVSVASLEAKIIAEQHSLAEAQSQEIVAQAAMSALHLQLVEAQGSASTAQQAHAAVLVSMQQEVSALQAHDRESAAEIVALRASVHTLSEADSSGMCVELQHTIDELHAREVDTGHRLVDLQATNAAQHGEVGVLQADVAQLTSSAGSSGSLIAELKGTVEGLRAAEAAQSAELAAKSAEIAQLNVTIDELRLTITSAEERISEITQTVDELHGSQDAAMAREDQYMVDIERLETDLLNARQQADSATESDAVASELQHSLNELRLRETEGAQKMEALRRSLQERDEELLSRDAQILELEERGEVDAETVSSLRLRLAESLQFAATAAQVAESVRAEESNVEQELRAQVEELSDSLEILAMDKEQLLMDNELLEEKVLSLQTDLDVYAQGGSGPDGPSNAQLSVEAHRLQASLARMNDLSAEDKELIATQAALLEELELECGDLRAYRDQASADLTEMRGTVDGVASYEEMIERLTEQNLELSEQLATSNQLVADLEESVELNEELDARQTQQIADDRRVIDTLNVTMAAYDRQLAERDAAAADLTRQLEKLKHANKGLQAEVQLLKDTIQLDSLESRSVESKLRDVALMKTQQELLAQEVHALYNQCIAANAQKFRFQALFVRMDAIFGSSSFYLEESKLVNTEVVFVSTLSTGLDALRLVSSLTTLVTDGKVAVELQECGAKHVKSFVSLYLLLLRAQYFAIQSGVALFRDGDDLGRACVQRLMSVKALFERTSQLSLKLTELNSRVAAVNNSARDRALNAASELSPEGMENEVGNAADENDFEAVSSSSSVELQQQVAFDELAASLVTVMQELRGLASEGEEKGDETEWSFGEGGSAVPLAQVEMCLLSLNAVVDLASFEHRETDAMDSFTPRTPKKQSRSDLTAFSVLEQLKSLKMELKGAAFGLKQHAAHYVQHTAELEDCCVSLQRDLVAGDGDVQGSIKAVLSTLRGINSAASARSSGVAANITIGVSGILRYFPLILMTNIATSVGAQRQQEETALREQFAQHSEKFWNLLIQNSSDLLVGVGGGDGGVATTPTKRSVQVPGSSGEVSWKGRVAELRKIVSGRLGSAPAQSLSPKKGASSSSSSSGMGQSPRAEEAYFEPQQQVVAAEQHAAVVQELDLKKDELKSALRKCHELQSMHDAALLSSAAAAQEAHQEMVRQLRSEMRVMEDALKSTENRADAVEKEARLIRNHHHSQSLTNVNTPPPKAETRAERLSRRQSQADMNDAQKSSFSLSSLLASVGEAAAPSPAHHHVHDSSAQYQLLLDQASHWRRVAMKKLTQSLLPLPEISPLSTSRLVDPSTAGRNLPVEYAPGTTVRQPNAFAVHNVELLGYDADSATSADYTALYRKIRLLRASSVRIRAIDGGDKATGGEMSRSEALRSRIKAKTNVVYRVSSLQ